MPLLRYLCFVGAILFSALYLLGDHEKVANGPSEGPWTALDTLRAMAHHGEPAQRASALAYAAASQPVGNTAIRAELPQAAVEPAIKLTPENADALARMPVKPSAREIPPQKSRRQVAAKRTGRERKTVATVERQPFSDPFGSLW